jgi:DNA-binding CsgD family transcriptional regulator
MRSPCTALNRAARVGEFGLTEREIEILFWISRGKTNYEISVILGAKQDTVRTHVSSILRKLCVENRTAAAVTAFELMSDSQVTQYAARS